MGGCCWWWWWCRIRADSPRGNPSTAVGSRHFCSRTFTVLAERSGPLQVRAPRLRSHPGMVARCQIRARSGPGQGSASLVRRWPESGWCACRWAALGMIPLLLPNRDVPRLTTQNDPRCHRRTHYQRRSGTFVSLGDSSTFAISVARLTERRNETRNETSSRFDRCGTPHRPRHLILA